MAEERRTGSDGSCGWDYAAWLLRQRPRACPRCAASTVEDGGFGGPSAIPDPAIVMRGRIEPNRLTNKPPIGPRRTARLRPDNHETIEGPQVCWVCQRCGFSELLVLVGERPKNIDDRGGWHWQVPESDLEGP